MIELNCTYEESKKILELGYDFSRVCTKFECRDDDDMKVVFGEKVTEDTIRNQYTVVDNEPWFQGKAWCQDFIPIIPKAALEACLSKSAYEAFIWCHENYPKELKKKFEEVMG